MAMSPIRGVRKIVVAIAGGLVVVVGLILIPLPGPGTLIVFAGLVILGSEFAIARRWADRIRDTVKSALTRGRQDRDAQTPADDEPEVQSG